MNSQKIKEILDYYKEYLFESKKEDIKKIEEKIKNNENDFGSYLVGYELAKKWNLRAPIINYLYKEKNKGENKTEEKFNKVVLLYENLEKMISDKKIKKMNKHMKLLLLNYFNDINNKEILLKIFNQDTYEFFINLNNNTKVKKENQYSEKKDNNLKEEIYKISSKNSSQYSSRRYDDNLSQKNLNQNIDYIYPPIKNEIFSKFLNNGKILLHINSHKNFYYDKTYYIDNNVEKIFDKFMEYKETKKEICKTIKLFFDFLEQMELGIKKYCLFNCYLELQLKFKREEINNNDDTYIDNITCIYTFNDPINNKAISFKDINILIDGIDSKAQGFTFLLYDLNNIYEKIQYIKNSYIDKLTKIEKTSENTFLTKKAPDYKIIELIKIFSEFDKTAEYNIELSNSFYLSYGDQNNLIIYDKKYEEKIIINILNDLPYKVIEKSEYNEKTEKITLLCCSNVGFQIINLDFQSFEVEIEEYPMPRIFKNFIEMEEDNIIITGYEGAFYFTNLFKKNCDLKEKKITDKTYRGGIKINDKIAALTSNSIIINGEDKLLLYNIKSKQIFEVIKGYSFIVSNNGLTVIHREELEEKKILLCSCKKYKNGQKNGILLVNIKLDDCKIIENEFYETDNFEVYCSCQILDFENNNINSNKYNNKKLIIEDKEYFFLVGGFDLDKRVGIIKLFKLIYNIKNITKTKIEFIQDIEFGDNFENFDRPISCINQSKSTGNISATCYNGKIYLFTQPNLKYFLGKN